MSEEKTVGGTRASIKTKVDELQQLDRVLIRWVDAHMLFLEGWVTLAYIEALDVQCTVESLGYFVCQKEDFIVLGMDVIRSKDDEFENEYNSASAIPIACIKSIEVIDNG